MRTPENEIYARIEKIKKTVLAEHPFLHGIFIFSRINLYYFTGTLAHGFLYIPFDADPVLFVRKGLERAKSESPLTRIFPYKSYSETEKICADLSMPLPQNARFGMEKSGLTLQLAELFTSKIKAFSVNPPVNIDTETKIVRSIKSEYELEKIREAGKRQALVLEKILPQILLHAIHGNPLPLPSLLQDFRSELDPKYSDFREENSLSEKNIAKLCIQLYTELGHGFMCRMSAHGEEAFYGHIACGENLNKAHYYNGAMGFAGLHPALPCLGSDKIWQKGEALLADMLFNFEGYHTDKTQMYFYGSRNELPDIAKKAWECCEKIQSMVLSDLKAGNIPEEIYKKSLQIAAQFGFAENFMGYAQNSVPFLGHGTGLCVDEFPVIAKNFKNPLQNGMIIACEPKIGIPGFGMVGVENTFELIDNTVKNLTSEHDGIIFIS